MNIYVGNLSQDVSEAQLREAFASFGEVQSVKVIMDNFTGRPKGFGFVEMNDDSQAEEAVKELNNSKLGGQFIVVKEARPKAANTGFNSNRGGFSRSNNNNSRRY